MGQEITQGGWRKNRYGRRKLSLVASVTYRDLLEGFSWRLTGSVAW